MTDELSKIICQECAFKLDQFFDFREKCIETEEMFREMLKTLARNEDVIEMAKKIEEIATPSTSPVLDMALSEDNKSIAPHVLNHEETNIEVESIHLDRDTVRMVDEHIREVNFLLCNFLYFNKISCFVKFFIEGFSSSRSEY